ncbi:glycoside hydrolase family 3 N-terminal domain-containing protein [Actinophytocola oryzae]|uniref:Beta-xylosidase n=1 Tax=Actinophytocola oryzae TaxID=502181 RepID=A0A4R7VN49_9PSEU|nr:glycoside hydrolase family 3 N-terminal domain-containing protein [Actinophytocola oryzae]TDV51063.1 beta-xylosidase [Actinophytocola oryzae]
MREEPWRDPARPAAERVADLVNRMTLREKLGQLYGVWLGQSSSDGEDDVAPFQHDLVDNDLNWPELIKNGLGQLTRPFGSAPVEPAAGAARLAALQGEIVSAGRFGIPAIAHEECLTGFMTHKATVYPIPLAWGATWSPSLAEEMAATIGAGMREVGVHQGLAPVLDVTRDVRWGRSEETIGEDPHLVATIGAAYVRGLRSAGILATLKHFIGYSASRGARNFGPVAIGPRELADVLLPPFLAGLRAGGESVMPSYADVDGVPPAANHALLTGLLRDRLGFEGTVVSDYFSLAFIELQHGLAANPGEAAGLALAAGVDVELPNVRCFGTPLLDAVLAGDVPESLVDAALTRVLRQKCDLGLLDPGWVSPQPSTVDFDPPESRALARRVAEESVVLLANDGVLPLRSGTKVALVGAQADTPSAMLGCYTFPQHVPSAGQGVAIPTLREAFEGEMTYAEGGEEAVAAAREADVCVVTLGDTAGLFGRGTSGEGTDATNLVIPGVELLDAVLATGTPVVLVLLTGKPYALGAYVGRCAAIVQAFFPGEEGGAAVAGVLSGRVNPSGRLPVSVPTDPYASPSPYLAPPLGRVNGASSVDPTPAFPFGYGLSYTSFEWSDFTGDGLSASVTVTNTGPVAGSEVVQLYLHDPVAQVVRPVVKLLGYAKVRLEPGESRTVTFDVPEEATAFTGLSGRRIVEPGDVELRIAASAVEVRQTFAATVSGPEREIGPSEERDVSVTVR